MAKVSHRARHNVSYLDRAGAIRRRGELKALIRIAKASVLGMSLSVPEWSPVRAWQNAPYNADKRRAEAELAAIDERFPSPAWWQPRKASAADRRIARQYDETATPLHESVICTILANDLRTQLRRNLRMREYDDYRAMIRQGIDAVRLAECGIVCHPENDLPDPRENPCHPDRDNWQQRAA